MSELGKALNDALDAATGPGTVHAEADGRSADVDVVDVDRLGVRCRAVRLHGPPRDVLDDARDLPDRVRALGESLAPVEVDPGLGGSIFRSEPEDGEFYELGAHSTGDVELKRVKGGPGTEREVVDFTLTRKQLGKLIDEVG